MFKSQLLIALSVLSLLQCKPSQETMNKKTEKSNYTIEKTTEEWKEVLSPEAYNVLREKGTERPFEGEYNSFYKDGVYTCKGCGEKLFSSESKYDSHSGWPSFDKEIEKGKIKEILDTTHHMTRVEVVCSNCGGHLGHMFNDGPTETGLRYCVNSISLDFKKDSLNKK